MHLLNRMPIRYKLYILVALTALALAGAVGFAANILYDRMLNDRIDKMRAATDIAASYAQLLEDQVKTGKLSRAEAMVRFREIGHAMRYDGEGGYVFATNLDGMVVLHPHTEFEGTTGPVDASGRPIMPMLIAALQAADSATIRYTFAKPQGGEALPKLTYIRMFAPWKIIIASGMWIDDIDADMRAALLQLGIAGLGMITLIALMAFFLSRNITVPLGVLKDKMQLLADGDLSVEVPDDGRSDEIGWMIRAVQVFRENGLAMRGMEHEKAALAKQNVEQRQQGLLLLAQDLEAHVGAIVTEVAGAAQHLQATAEAMS